MSDHPQPGSDSTGDSVSESPVLLITAWHLRHVRSMPRAFLHIRRLDLATRGEAGCLWVHRWISLRSVLLTTTWQSERDAQRWLRSADFTRTDRALRSIDGTVARVELFCHHSDESNAPLS